jgi:hypothetical protein
MFDPFTDVADSPIAAFNYKATSNPSHFAAVIDIADICTAQVLELPPIRCEEG